MILVNWQCLPTTGYKYCSISPSRVLARRVMAGVLSVPFRKPEPRAWHRSWQAGSKSIIQGGMTQDFSTETQRRLSSVVYIFDPYTEKWQEKKVNGEALVHGLYAAASASVNDEHFTFGGRGDQKIYNSLHRLKDVSQWTELCPKEKSQTLPMEKQGAGMVAFGDRLAVFGGYGVPHGHNQRGSSFIMKDTTNAKRYRDVTGWTNEFHIYRLDDGTYTPQILIYVDVFLQYFLNTIIIP